MFFCLLWGLPKTIVYAEYRIWISLVGPIPDPAENASIGADTDAEYRISASLSTIDRCRAGTELQISRNKTGHPWYKENGW